MQLTRERDLALYQETLPIYFPPATTNAPADEAKAEAAAGEKKDETTEAAAVQTSNL